MFKQANKFLLLSSQTWEFTLFKIPVCVLKDLDVLEMYILIIKSCFSLELCTLFRLNSSGSTEGSISPLKASRVVAVTSPSAERISRLSMSSGSNLKRFFCFFSFWCKCLKYPTVVVSTSSAYEVLAVLALRRLKFTYSDLLFH